MKIIKIITSLVLCLIILGCEEFLEIETPKDQIDQNVIFDDEKMAVAAISNVYTQLRSNGFFVGNRLGSGYLLGCYTDELEVVNPQISNHKSFYENTVLSNNAAVNDLWTASYQQIFSVNSILEGLSRSSNLSTETKNQIRGEALAIRGMLHFYLTNTFGSVPYISTTDYNANKITTKMLVDEVIKNVLNDLLEAEGLLTVNYPSTEKIRLNQIAVKALLARVYLYKNDWVSAKKYADDVISIKNNELEQIDSVFLKDSKSAIWQLKAENSTKNTLEAIEYIFQTIPAPQSKITEVLINSFEKGDLRKKNWLKFIGDSDSYACAYKYKVLGNSSPSKEYSVILRVEEMYLVSAESAAEMLDFETGNNLLNIIRSRAGLSSIHLQSKEELIEAILHERRLEFFCEFGHRFFDLKRRNLLNNLSHIKQNWKPFHQLLPLPESELLLNNNLAPQNAGY
ncbi:RagB/SusD family nutrient uptake outer membrane protein [Flavobacterium sp. xlx-214]|uniref:RagB/SusD family nutrient uptake outer membrane protein n=1 Tax=unclassified Flavobacterium TaxID=196869 RepID=UPI0013D33CAA|nr:MULTISPECIES: RagB/SusD family nutrient uptake outer membrane protein [unclassified Flavobacterium]MBA5791561.1 RagB/SusD family nutrient uptake outer membrane protein [Flavobacterium sp. xlx-221]QMI82810.1 RagB/SusD family nutrient uptake outer membrane protein [Flavobacterium sp. xlx-214]